MMRVLGIETSCDETGVAVYDSQAGLLVHRLYSQADLHMEYGGVVPELASRDHVRRLLPLVSGVLKESGSYESGSAAAAAIDGIAYTIGPGLVGALLVGATVGRTLAWAWGVPAVGVHHMEAHLLAVMLEKASPAFPFLALIVSGGHTLLVVVRELGQYEVLGETLDDAAGEAFDKTAKLLGLPYPGGPELANLAEQGDPERFYFPRPMVNRPGLDFSFSGLKTCVLNEVNRQSSDTQTRADIACAFQEAVVDTLVVKCKRALMQTGMNQLVLAGGVAANKLLRTRIKHVCERMDVKTFYPRPEFCTDNGAMVAYAGCQRLLKGEGDDLNINVRPRYSLEDL